MTHSPVARALAGPTGRRVQTLVVGLVLLISTGASVLAAALLVDSHGTFDHVFAAQNGAHVTTAVDLSEATAGQLAAATRLPQVTAAAGSFAETTIGVSCTPVTVKLGGPDEIPLEPMTLAGRASPGGPVDDIALASGHWVQEPGQVVLQYSCRPADRRRRRAAPGQLGRENLDRLGAANRVRPRPARRPGDGAPGRSVESTRRRLAPVPPSLQNW